MSVDDTGTVLGLELDEFIRDAIKHPRRVEALRYEAPQINFESSTFVVELDVAQIVTDTVARVTAAEEAIREKVIVEYLRAHGWTVTKEES
jgi:hypothetical protein